MGCSGRSSGQYRLRHRPVAPCCLSPQPNCQGKLAFPAGSNTHLLFLITLLGILLLLIYILSPRGKVPAPLRVLDCGPMLLRGWQPGTP